MEDERNADRRELNQKQAWLELLSAHLPTLAENTEQRFIMQQQLSEFLGIFSSYQQAPDSEEQHKANVERHAKFMDEVLSRVSLKEIDRLRILYQLARKSLRALEDECKIVVMDRVNKGDTEGLDPETVEDAKGAIREEAAGRAFKALFEGANVIDLDALLAKREKPTPKAPPITS